MNFTLPPAPLDEPEMVREPLLEALRGQALRVKKYGESMKLSVQQLNSLSCCGI